MDWISTLIPLIAAFMAILLVWKAMTMKLDDPDDLEKELSLEPIGNSVNPFDHIFISYRRADSRDITDRIYDRLADINVRGTKKVFRDVDHDISPGMDFSERLNQALQQSKTCLVIIGTDWLDIQDSEGNRRLENPQDMVRIEIETAAQSDVRVIPVLVQNASVPLRRALPSSIQYLNDLQFISIRPNPDFNSDMDHLIKAIEQY